MKEYNEYILDEQCELIDQKLIEEGFLDFFKKKPTNATNNLSTKEKVTYIDSSNKDKSIIATTYKDSKVKLGEIGTLLINGKYEEILNKFSPLISDLKELEKYLKELTKGQKKVKELQKKNQEIDDDAEAEDLASKMSSVKTENCFNY